MDTFKVNYKNNGKYFSQDIIEEVQLLDIDFNIESIKKHIDNKINFFKCNIPLPLDIIYKNLMNYNIYIEFNDYLVKISEKKINISNERFSKQKITFENTIEESTSTDNFYNPDIICKIFIDMIESISISKTFQEGINIMNNILNRMYYQSIEESYLCNKLYNTFCHKLFEIISKLDIDNINNDLDDYSMISEIIEILKLSKIDLSFKFENKEYILFEKLKKLVQDDRFIKTYKYDTNKFEDKIYNESKNFYYSSITRTSWIDEMEYKNISGLLVKIDPKEINKNAYNLDFIPIVDITHTIISLEQILEAYKVYHKTWNTLSDKDMGTNIISGFGIGEGNCMIPLYICDEHWKMAEIYNDYNFGIIFNRNPLISKNKYCDLYYNILSNMIDLTFSNQNYNSDKWIQLLFSMLRTVYELSKHDKHLINRFVKDKIYRIDCNVNKILILSLFDSDNISIRYIIEEQIRRKMKSIFRNISPLDNLYNFNNPSDAIKYEFLLDNLEINNIINDNNFNILIQTLEENNIFSSLITTIHGIISMRNIILNKFSTIFNSMDEIGGILKEELVHSIKNEIINKLIKPSNFSLKTSINNKFSSHINFTKNKKFNITTLYDNYILDNDLQLKAIIIQSIIQRVDKCRRKAINNNKYSDSFNKDNYELIIKNTGILISSRFIRNYYNLTSIVDYVRLLNTMNPTMIELFLMIININKTVSLKSKLEDNLNLITNFETREIIRSYYKNGSFSDKYSSYNIYITN